MTAPDLTPAGLVAQWRPKLRRIAWVTGADLSDIEQQAWLLAATMRPGDDLVPRWLAACARHARSQAPRAVIEMEGLPDRAGGDDPAEILIGVEAVAARLGQDLQQLVAMPGTAREIAQALRVSERQGRRIKRQLEAMGARQGDFWLVPGV